METEAPFILYDNVMEEMNIIHERTMNIRHLVSWGYKEEFNNQRHRHKMGGDEGVHSIVKDTEEDGD